MRPGYWSYNCGVWEKTSRGQQVIFSWSTALNGRRLPQRIECRVSTKRLRVQVNDYGIFLGDDRWGGLFVDRYDFRPRLLPARLETPPWRKEQLPEMAFPESEQERLRAQTLLDALAQWIATYEHWVSDHASSEYRRKVFRAWHKRPVVSPEALATTWQQLGEAFRPRVPQAA